MKLLLDTCTFLWLVLDGPELSDRARASLLDDENELHLSAVSAWEIALKHALGRLPLPEAPEVYVPRLRESHGIVALALDEAATLCLGRLPPLHRDPFDRMLICQSIVGGMAVVTPDPLITQYPIRCVW